MLEVRQGGRSCELVFKEFRVADCAEFDVEDLWCEATGITFDVNGATIHVTEDGLVLHPGPNVLAFKPHRGLRVMWNGPLIFRKDEEERISCELLASYERTAA
jgi:hypothetical protein